VSRNVSKSRSFASPNPSASPVGIIESADGVTFFTSASFSVARSPS
jgi:hypothetical protein